MNSILDKNNRLFELARSGKRQPPWLVVVILSFVIVLTAQIAGGIPAVALVLALSMVNQPVPLDDVEQVIQAAMPDTALDQTIFLILAFSPIFLLLWGWLALFEKRRLRSIGLEWVGALKNYGRGLLIGLMMFAAAIGLAALPGYIIVESSTTQPQGVAAIGGVLLVMLGWMVQGAAEEAIARGWVLPVIGGRYHPVAGILVSSVVFAAFHSFNPNLSPIAILNLFLFGLFAALYALYEGGLWGVFSIHSVWNWAQGNLFGFEVSGMASPGGTVFNLMETGPDIITGGAFGPEGGLAVTVVLVISCLLVWLAADKRRATSNE
jgi:membrane protease YdiL (CAAX protease family)